MLSAELKWQSTDLISAVRHRRSPHPRQSFAIPVSPPTMPHALVVSTVLWYGTVWEDVRPIVRIFVYMSRINKQKLLFFLENGSIVLQRTVILDTINLFSLALPPGILRSHARIRNFIASYRIPSRGRLEAHERPTICVHVRYNPSYLFD